VTRRGPAEQRTRAGFDHRSARERNGEVFQQAPEIAAILATQPRPLNMPLAKRVAGIDRYMAPRWFKTVTRVTWDDNNFLPGDYAINPVRGLRVWRAAAEPPLHVWVRYLCEFYAQDFTLELDKLAVPTLIVQPGLDGIYHDPGNNYMQAFTHTCWDGAADSNPKIRRVTIPNSRACLWFDQPEKLDAIVDDFLRSAE
jgi:pimeloyl-ACP methyl ester carboxylesterase